jgi:hypothetical protein
MKYIITALVFGYASSLTHAQTLTNHVVANSGNSYSSSALNVEQTTGESVITTIQSGNLIVTQGFHQPSSFTVGVEEEKINVLTLWPNPAREAVTISGAKQPIELIEIFDAVGKLVVTHSQKSTFSVAPLAGGSYVVRLQSGALNEEHRLVVVD